MSIRLDVPLVGQVRSMSCWYACSCMIAYYRHPGPRLGIPEAWEANTGLSHDQWPELAANEGHREVPWPHAGAWSSATLEQALRIYGPLLAHGRFYHAGHVIVITGVDGDTIRLNDPWEPQRKTNTIAWFNTNLWGQRWRPLWYYPA